MPEGLGSIRETVALSQGEVLDSAEALLRGQGYEVVRRAAAFVTGARRIRGGGVPGPALRTLTVAVAPQPGGGVRVELRGDDGDGVRERQAEWSRWAEGLPKLDQSQGSHGTTGARPEEPAATEDPGEGSAYPGDDREDEPRASEARQPDLGPGGATGGEEFETSGAAGGWVSGGAWDRRPRAAPGKREGEAVPSREDPPGAAPGTDEPEQSRDTAHGALAKDTGAEPPGVASGGGEGVPESEATERPGRRCPNCGAAAGRGDAFCDSCGSRLAVGPEAFETGTLSPSQEAGRSGEGLLRRSREVYERGSARYREWSETRAAERRRAEAGRLLNAARATFERIDAGSSTFLEWWDEYEDERSPATAPLADARDLARGELERIARVEGELAGSTHDDGDAFVERANAALDDLETGRAAALVSLEEFGRNLEGIGGWEKYKEEFAAFARGLGLETRRSTVPAGERFPDPHRRRTYKHKMVQIRPTIAVHGSAYSGDDAARYLQDVVDQHTVDGWEFYRVDTLSVAVPPGCLAAFFGAGPTQD